MHMCKEGYSFMQFTLSLAHNETHDKPQLVGVYTPGHTIKITLTPQCGPNNIIYPTRRQHGR